MKWLVCRLEGLLVGWMVSQLVGQLVGWLVCLISACTSAEGMSAMNCMHECLCKTHSWDCPHGEVAFSNSNINKKQCTIKICQITSFMSTMGKWHLMISFHHSRQIYYGEMIHYDFISPWWIITYCNLTTNLLWWNDTLWFHFTIVDYYILQFDKFLSYKDIRRKAFFTMATLLMLLLENESFKFAAFWEVK